MAGELQAPPRSDTLRRPSTSPVQHLRQCDSQAASRQLSPSKSRVCAPAQQDSWAAPAPAQPARAGTVGARPRSPARRCTADGTPAFAAPQRRSAQKLPLFQPPHMTHQFQHSGAKAVKELAHRISQHCPPAHNWDTRRQELQGSVEENAKEAAALRRACRPQQDRVLENAACVWGDALPFMRKARHAELMRLQAAKAEGVAKERKQRAEARRLRVASEAERLARLRQARIDRETIEERGRQGAAWLQTLWVNAALQRMRQVVLDQRKSREVLHSQYQHIVRIQACVRMWLARRHFLQVKKATTYIQISVRRFLAALYVRRRQASATIIVGFLRNAHKANRLCTAFQRVMNSITVLKQAVRHFCLVRDARKVVLKTQWTRWEAAHHRRITKDIQYRGTAVASEPKGSVIRDCDFTLVSDTIKTHVCKLHLQAKLQEWHRFRKEADRERERLRGAHGLHVIMEKCFLLGLNPARNEEYLAAMARVDADTPAVPPFRVIETPLVVSRLHRQGMRMQASQKAGALKASDDTGPTAGVAAAPARPPKA